MFRNALHDLFGAQTSRLSKVVSEDIILAARNQLEANNLDEDSINRECMKELSIILTKTYDIELSSGRLNNRGWSTAHIRDHMGRFFQSKMKAVGNIYKLYVQEGIEPSEESIKNALRENTTARKPITDDFMSNLEDLDSA